MSDAQSISSRYIAEQYCRRSGSGFEVLRRPQRSRLNRVVLILAALPWIVLGLGGLTALWVMTGAK